MTITTTRGLRYTVGIDSEIGALRDVIVHCPGPELARLTPGTIAELLFDDPLWASRARDDHEAFVEALEEYDVNVHLFGDLLAEALATPDGRAFALDRTCTAEHLGPGLARDVRALFDDSDAVALSRYLIGGVSKADLSPLGRPSLTWHVLDVDDFVLAPLPNTLFQRDNAAWLGRGVGINTMTRDARRRESVNTRCVYRYHPRLRDAAFRFWYGEDHDDASARLDGSDIHVIAPGVVLVGMAERSTPMGIELFARRLFASGAARVVLAVEVPRSRSAVHLDALLTMVDMATFVAHPFIDWSQVRCWRLTPGDDPADVEVARRIGVSDALAEVLGVDETWLLTTDRDGTAERARWDDADNYLALAPGVVMGYDRNVATNDMLRRYGIDVVILPGGARGRGRGGARCMSCPIRRDPL